MKRIFAALIFLLALPAFAAPTIEYSAINQITTGSSTAVSATWVSGSSANDAIFVAVSETGGATITGVSVNGCTLAAGQLKALQINPTAPVMQVWYAEGVPAGCTGCGASFSYAVSNASIMCMAYTNLPAAYTVENWDSNFTSNPNSPSTTLTTTGTSDALFTVVIDTNGYPVTFAPGAGFTSYLNVSTAVPVMQVATASGGPGTYANATTGCSAAGRCPQVEVAIRSVVPTFGVVQFSLPCSGSGTSMTCSLLQPVAAGDLLYACGLPEGSGDDTEAIPTDTSSNTYKPVGMWIPTTNGQGQCFYVKNAPAAASLTVTFSTQAGGSASVYTAFLAEIHGANSVSPYVGAFQDLTKNAGYSTGLNFGPFTPPPGSAGNYLMLGVGAEPSAFTYPNTITGGVQLGPYSIPVNGLINTFVGTFSGNSAHTIAVTNTGQTYSWMGAVFSDTAQTQGIITQSAFCSYSCAVGYPGGTALKTFYPVDANSTILIVVKTGAGVSQTLTSSPALTFTKYYGTASDDVAVFVAQGVAAGTYDFTMANIGNGIAHLAVIENLGTIDGALCNQGLVSGEPINSGAVTTAATDIIISAGGVSAGFGDQPAVQDGSWPQSFSSQFSDYDGMQLSALYYQPAGSYVSANYTFPLSAGSGTTAACIIPFKDAVQPSTAYGFEIGGSAQTGGNVEHQ